MDFLDTQRKSCTSSLSYSQCTWKSKHCYTIDAQTTSKTIKFYGMMQLVFQICSSVIHEPPCFSYSSSRVQIQQHSTPCTTLQRALPALSKVYQNSLTQPSAYLVSSRGYITCYTLLPTQVAKALAIGVPVGRGVAGAWRAAVRGESASSGAVGLHGVLIKFHSDSSELQL